MLRMYTSVYAASAKSARVSIMAGRVDGAQGTDSAAGVTRCMSADQMYSLKIWQIKCTLPSPVHFIYYPTYSLQAGRPKKSFLFGPCFFNITNVFCAKKWVGHACICPRMVTG